MTNFSTSIYPLILYIIKGVYDDQLKWPFTGEIEVKLLDQISNVFHHTPDKSLTKSINRNVNGGEGDWFYTD